MRSQGTNTAIKKNWLIKKKMAKALPRGSKTSQ